MGVIKFMRVGVRDIVNILHDNHKLVFASNSVDTISHRRYIILFRRTAVCIRYRIEAWPSSWIQDKKNVSSMYKSGLYHGKLNQWYRPESYVAVLIIRSNPIYIHTIRPRIVLILQVRWIKRLTGPSRGRCKLYFSETCSVLSLVLRTTTRDRSGVIVKSC